MEEHARVLREQMERAREHMHAAMKQARDDMERARTEFEDMMARTRRNFELHPDWPRPEDFTGPPKRRRRPRRPRGGELAPVKPKPKPKPLVDGAEAPIE